MREKVREEGAAAGTATAIVVAAAVPVLWQNDSGEIEIFAVHGEKRRFRIPSEVIHHEYRSLC